MAVNAYQSFLRSPNASSLAPDASISYITTTTTIREPEAVIRHLKALEDQVQRKQENVLSCLEGSNSICLEIETTFLFKNGGGVYLPNMDLNMLTDTTATCVMIHIVSFDADKISQIRIHWDQSTLLKQIEAVGKSGRNWPIRDGKEQVRAVKDSVAKVKSINSAANQAQSTAASRPNDEYAARIFSPTDSDTQQRSFKSLEVQPRDSARPQDRPWGELFAGENSAQNEAEQRRPGQLRSPHDPVFKGGAGKNNAPNRLFDEHDTPADSLRSPERKIQDPSKFNHFEFGNGEDAAPLRPIDLNSTKAKKQVSNWDFDDFETPLKLAQKPNPAQQRSFDYNTDANGNSTPSANPDAQRQRVNPASKVSNNTPSWSLADMTHSSAEAPQKVYKTAGDGMGGKLGGRGWAFGYEDEPMPAQQKVYKTAGDGMGGKGNREWSLGGA